MREAVRFCALSWLFFALAGWVSARGQSVDYYAGIWEKSDGPAWVAVHRLTEAEYQAAFTQYVGQGYRLRQVTGYSLDGADYYAALWDKAASPAWVGRHRLTAAEFQTAFSQYVAQGYRLAWIHGYGVNDVDYYAAIWEQRSGTAWVARHRLTAGEYQDAFTQYLRQGYRLAQVSAYSVAGVDYYAALWDKDPTPAWAARHRMSSADFQTAFNQYATQGYRLRQLCGYEVAGVDYYAAIWDQAASPAWVARHRLSAADFQTAFDTYLKQGYRLVALDGYSIGAPPGPVPDVPASGVPVAALQAFDDHLKCFVAARHIPAAALCVSRHGAILLERGYGWQDQAGTVPLRPNALFRIASLSKPLTAAAIRRLVAEGRLRLEDRVFDLGQTGGGLLQITPVGLPDPRLSGVTVAHLLAHTGGWDRELSGDPMFDSIAIARALGIPSPPEPLDIARYMMGRPLDHAPGTVEAYSNFGYLLLGLIIERVTGREYVDYLHQALLAPLGVAEADVQLGRTLPSQRNAREPYYSDPGVGPSVFAPQQTVGMADGGFYLEAMKAHGGLIASARAYARFLGAYWIDGSPRTGDGQAWGFYGSLPGTWTLARQNPNGFDVVAFFNQRTDGSGLGYDDIQLLMDGAGASIAAWPTQDVSLVLPSPPLLSLSLAPPAMIWPTEAGRVYQVQHTTDWVSWADFGVPAVGTGNPARTLLNLSATNLSHSSFYRVSVE